MILLFLFACNIIGIEDNWNNGNVTQIKDFFTSTFLITPSDGSLILIDSGYNKEGKPILNHLETLGKSKEDISMIFLTHGHTDHVRGTNVFPHAEVYALAEEQEELDESNITIDVPITHGQVISIGDSTLEVFSVPGHSSGNAVFLVDDILIFGDSAQGLKDGTISTVAEKYSDDPQKAEDELEKLAQTFQQRATDVSWLAFSHTGSIEGIQALLDYKSPN